MEWREISPEDLYGLRKPLIIDVRSPCEHAAEQIPGSISIPLLTDQERAVVGLVYNQQGDLLARRRALEIIAPRIPELIERILQHKTHAQAIVVHCWRGGLRSEAVSSVLSIAGVPSYRLKGGYKAWRSMVLKELKEDRYYFEAVVLHGLSGTGKTEILQALHQLGNQILDLEEIANHRGSTFGGLGKGKQPGQKNFDAELWRRLKQLDPGRPVFLEAESRKIGRIALPDPVFNRILKGRAVLATGTSCKRARRLAEAYISALLPEEPLMDESLAMLDRIMPSLGKQRTAELKALVQQGNIVQAVKILLAEYYDPLYARSLKGRTFELQVNGDDPQAAALQLHEWASAECLLLSPGIKSD